MSARIAVFSVLAAIAVVGFSTSFAPAAEPSTQELLDQIKQLQAKVEQLEARQNQTSADVAATVDQIVKDAQRRSQLLATDGEFLAGHDGKTFFLKSSDGNYLLIPSAELQIRNTTNYDSQGDGSTENGFEIRRFKIRLEGNAISPDLTYALQYANSSSTGTPNLEDAWVKYQWKPGWYVRGGQLKDPLLHEQLTSGRRQLTADRSLLSLELTGSSDNYVQGVTAIYDGKDQPWRIEAGFTDGIGSQNTTWRDFPATSTNWGAAGRVEYFVYGDRAQYDDFTALGNKKNLLVLGAAGDVTQAGSDTVYTHTVDVQWEDTTGWSAYAAYVGQYINASGGDLYNYGLEMQGAYLFRPEWEGFVRWDFIKFDNDVTFATGGSEDWFNEITVGLNRYIKSHYAKFTLDFTYLPNGAPADQIGLGELGGDDAQFVLRAQFQLVL
jgi:hypothetical protein